MARQIRIEFSDAHYHIFTRGERKDTIFTCDLDNQKFIEILKKTINKFNLKCIAFVLMKNHYHLYLITPDGNLSKAMHYLNSSYANWYVKKHNITGHIFQGRYKAILIDKENYSLSVIDYIHNNPVKENNKINSWEYKWSSCSNYCELDNNYKFIEKLNSLKQMDYLTHLKNKNNINLPHRNLYKGIVYCKDSEFKKKIDSFINLKKENKALPSTLMFRTRKINNIIIKICNVFLITEDDIFRNDYNNLYKKIFVYLLKKYTRLKNKEICLFFNIKADSVSDIYSRFKKKYSNDKKVMGLIEKIIADF